MHGPQGSLESPVKFVISMRHMVAPRMSSSVRKKNGKKVNLETLRKEPESSWNFGNSVRQPLGFF